MPLPTLGDDGIKKNTGKPSRPANELASDLPPMRESLKAETFDEVPVHEARNYDQDDYNESFDYEEQRQELPNMVEEQDVYASEDDYNPDYEEDEEVYEDEKEKFIDKKKKKLIPFGGNKSKRKVKSSDFDDRKNVLGKTKIIRLVIMGSVVLLFGLGVKNTFFPSHVYTEEQIRQFGREGAGRTGFPEERGAAFVENFMEAYLTFDNQRPELKHALDYYYGYSTSEVTVSRGANARQQVLISPSVYKVELFSSYSARYEVTAYVTDSTGIGDVSSGHWRSFAVNLYYDEVNDTLTVTKDSPSLVPNPRIAAQTTIPEEAPFGNGSVNEAILPALSPTINGFISAFADSTHLSHERVLPYIRNNDDLSLLDGFGGLVELNDDPSRSIRKVVYDTDSGDYVVVLEVDWLDTSSSRGDTSILYTSKYIMNISEEAPGKYFVDYFEPYNYLRK